MVRTPEFSDDSGFHREFLKKDIKVKVEPRIGAPVEDGSPQMCEGERIPDFMSFGMDFDEESIKDQDQDINWKEKYLTPPEVYSGTLQIAPQKI